MPAPGVKFVPNPGWEDAVLRSTDLVDALTPIAEQAESIAKVNAPRRLGYFEDSITAEVAYSPRHRAVIVHLASSDFKAWWIEAGTVDTHAVPTLVPAMEQAAPGARWENIA